MDDYKSTRSYLETLSTDDLAAKALQLGLDLPPELNRVFVIEEILEAITEDEEPEYRELEESAGDQDPEVMTLSEHYNQTFLEVLIRDPLWAFAFWEIRYHEKEEYEKSSQFEGYFLRVSSVPGQSPNKNESFKISVDLLDSAWYVCFPSPRGWFKVELCVLIGAAETVLAVSQPIKIPSSGTLNAYSDEDNPLKPILDLSGFGKLSITRSEDKSSRVRRCCE